VRSKTFTLSRLEGKMHRLEKKSKKETVVKKEGFSVCGDRREKDDL